MHATMTDFTYSLEKNYYKSSQIIITLISKIDLIVQNNILFISSNSLQLHSNACLIPQIFAKLMLIRLWTFRIPICRYRHNRSQNYFALFALFAYSNPIDVGTDVLLFIGFSGPTFYTKL